MPPQTNDLETKAIMRSNLAPLIAYLESHESDIAWGINDFGELRSTFFMLTGRKPLKEPVAVNA